MKALIFIVFFLVNSTKTTPPEFFKEDYNYAERFLQRHKYEINSIVKKHALSPLMVRSVVFPELVRYSIWKDYFETKSLELLYINDGGKGSYFSIGQFQIKPLFVEKLEEVLLENSQKYKNLLYITEYKQTIKSRIREERLRRLKQYEWQLRYVCAMIHVVNNTYNLEGKTEEELLKIYCSAYNHSFTCTLEENRAWQDRKLFPYGIKKENPFSYSEVALYYFRNND